MKNLYLIIIAFVFGILIYTILPNLCGCKLLEGHGTHIPEENRHKIIHILNSIVYREDSQYNTGNILETGYLQWSNIWKSQCTSSGNKIYNKFNPGSCARNEHYEIPGVENSHRQSLIVRYIHHFSGKLTDENINFNIDEIPEPGEEELVTPEQKQNLVKLAKFCNIIYELHPHPGSTPECHRILTQAGSDDASIQIIDHYSGLDGVNTDIINMLRGSLPTCADTAGDGSGTPYNCTSSVNLLDSDPGSITCNSGVCTDDDCCTIPAPPSTISADISTPMSEDYFKSMLTDWGVRFDGMYCSETDTDPDRYRLPTRRVQFMRYDRLSPNTYWPSSSSNYFIRSPNASATDKRGCAQPLSAIGWAAPPPRTRTDDTNGQRSIAAINCMDQIFRRPGVDGNSCDEYCKILTDENGADGRYLGNQGEPGQICCRDGEYVQMQWEGGTGGRGWHYAKDEDNRLCGQPENILQR